ncbi:MAG: protein-disulfide reductase DsbD [Methylococcales bacterium]|nr:protein-disulfide reductase DsbD [Methylococcales bacterium]
MPLINSFFLLLLLCLQSAFAAETLPPDQVFKVSATALNAEQIEVTWQIMDGYYLYRDKTRIESKTPQVSLGDAVFPKGEIKHDDYFGNMEIYHNTLKVIQPITADGATSVTLLLRYQGCAEKGICYPPQKTSVEVALPAIAAAPVAQANPLAALLQGSKKKDNLLPPEQAFQFFANVNNDNTVAVSWQIAKGYYLYRDKIHLELVNAPDTQLGNFTIPNGIPKEEEAFGKVEIFYDEVKFAVPLIRTTTEARTITLKASFQGCAERGVCYPPMTQTVELALPAANASTATATAAPVLSEQDQIVDSLKHDSFAMTLLSFFGFGLLLSLTPCIFPMIPILSGIIVGHGNHITTRRAFLLSLSYVVASALTYTLFGILAALFGENLQTLFQQPWIVGLFSAVFVLLSLSMFGFYNLQLPASIQTKLHNSSVRHQDGSLWGAAIMGALSSLIVGPCVAAPLAGALIFIGQTGDAVLGGSALFALGLGMGMPLLLLGASAGKLLPKAGNWMNVTKAVFGVVMLAVAVWMLSRVIPPTVTMLLWAMLLVLPSIYLSAIDPLPEHASGWRKLWKGVGVMMLVYGVLLLIGLSMGNSNLLKPLHGFAVGGNAQAAEQGLVFQRIHSVEELAAKVTQASAEGKSVMLDFYADWCVSCKEMEAYTFTDAKVKQALGNFVLLQADVTANSAADKALLEKFQLIGPPAILFFDKDQHEHPENRVIGYQDADTFLKSLQRVQ